MTLMRRRYVASTSLRRHVPAGNLAPPPPPQYSKPCPPPTLIPPPQYSKPSYANVSDLQWLVQSLREISGFEPSSETITPRNVKLVAVLSVYRLTLSFTLCAGANCDQPNPFSYSTFDELKLPDSSLVENCLVSWMIYTKI